MTRKTLKKHRGQRKMPKTSRKKRHPLGPTKTHKRRKRMSQKQAKQKQVKQTQAKQQGGILAPVIAGVGLTLSAGVAYAGYKIMTLLII